MKSKNIPIGLFVVLFSLAANTLAQTPAEQLTQMVAQLQKTPTDNSLREKIIKLAAEMKQSPAIPEEAERRMARGAAAFKGAKSVNDYQDAIKEFELAVAAAPWYSDAYFNLGVAQDKVEKFDAAVQSLKWAQMASPDSKDIKTLLYEVEYRYEKLNSQEARAAREKVDAENAKQAELKAQEERIKGTWQASLRSPTGYVVQYMEIKHQTNGDWNISISQSGYTTPLTIRGARLTDSGLRYVHANGPVCLYDDVRAAPSLDGQTLSLFKTPIQGDSWDRSCSERVTPSEMTPYVVQYTRTRP